MNLEAVFSCYGVMALLVFILVLSIVCRRLALDNEEGDRLRADQLKTMLHALASLEQAQKDPDESFYETKTRLACVRDMLREALDDKRAMRALGRLQALESFAEGIAERGLRDYAEGVFFLGSRQSGKTHAIQVFTQIEKRIRRAAEAALIRKEG